MSLQWVISGLLLGLASSFHCVGMCGAIAFSLPVHYLPPQKKLTGIILYNLGRVLVYAVLGLIFGIMGRQVYLAGFQQSFSITLGIVLLLVVVKPYVTKSKVRVRIIDRATLKLQNFIAAYIQKKQLYGMLFIGAANGLLPCAMVYFAITIAVASASVQAASLFMIFFGAGTLPLMLLLSYSGFVVGLNARNLVKRVTPYIMATMAVLLILRGMNLGIPYLSPYFDNTAARTISCH